MSDLENDDARCRSCGAATVSVFYEVRAIPAHNSLLLDNREAALAFPTGDMRLGVCASCSFMQNVSFDDRLVNYLEGYEDSQAYSPRFNAFAKELASHLIDRYDLRRKNIVEVGCGKGDFLVLLCELGHNRGIGFDPAHSEGAFTRSDDLEVEFVRDLYSEAYAQVRGDLFCCRHTLEHIPEVQRFVRMVRTCLADCPETVVYFELPDTTRILQECAFWDIYYEHCSYFTTDSLERLFRHNGFEVLDLRKGFDDQYLLLEARPRKHPEPVAEAVEPVCMDLTEQFSQQLAARLSAQRDSLDRVAGNGGRIVLWGGGSKAVGYLTSLGIRDEITYVVDINPKKTGKFLPGTGHEIVAPEFLTDYQPTLVILMNPIYQAEVEDMLRTIGVAAEVMAA